MGPPFSTYDIRPNQWFSRCVPGPAASVSSGTFGVTCPPGDSDAHRCCARWRASGWGDCLSVCVGWDGRRGGNLSVLCGQSGGPELCAGGKWRLEELCWRTCAWQPGVGCGAQTPATASGVSELAKDAGPSGGRRQGLGPEAAGKEDVWPLRCTLCGLDCGHPVFVVRGKTWPGCSSWMLEETQNERKASSRLDSTSNTVCSHLDELLIT